jgi:hypothetical protein
MESRIVFFVFIKDGTVVPLKQQFHNVKMAGPGVKCEKRREGGC